MSQKFVNANLQNSVFDNVDLSDTVIKGSNLSNFSITGSKITGLKINGIEIKPLIEAEMEKKDPVRTQLKANNIYSTQEIKEIFVKFEELRQEFYKLLFNTTQDLLIKKPKNNEWSAIKLVKHLLFSEDLRINYWLLRNEKKLSSYGQLPSHIKQEGRCELVGTNKTTDIKEILNEWQNIHGQMMIYVENLTDSKLKMSTKDVDMGQGDVAHILQDFVLHELDHIRQVEGLIKVKTDYSKFEIK